MARETSKSLSLRVTGPFFPPHLCLLVVRNRSWKCLDEGNFTLRSVWQRNVRFVFPRCTREMDGIAAKLLRCGIASEALRRNMPLRLGICHKITVIQAVPKPLPTNSLLIWGLKFLWVLFCPTLRVKSSGPVLVNVSRFSLILLDAFVSFLQISVNFSHF